MALRGPMNRFRRVLGTSIRDSGAVEKRGMGVSPMRGTGFGARATRSGLFQQPHAHLNFRNGEAGGGGGGGGPGSGLHSSSFAREDL